MKKSLKLTLALAAVLLIVGIVAFAFINRTDEEVATPVASKEVAATETPAAEAKPVEVAVQSTEELLLYLIEEEKLAHDVYTVMYQKYGANVFGNILESESTHQDKVLALLQPRNISDPRSSKIGVFKNIELQALYDALILQGNKSATEAYKAGVAIEQKDIADIGRQLATATDQDVIATLELLRNGSENHLRAFNKKL